MGRHSQKINKRKKVKEEESEESEEEKEEDNEDNEESEESEEETIKESDNDNDDDDSDSDGDVKMSTKRKESQRKESSKQKYSTVPLAPKKSTRRKTRIESSEDESDMETESQPMTSTQLTTTNKRKKPSNNDDSNDSEDSDNGHISDSDADKDDDDDDNENTKEIKKPAKKRLRKTTRNNKQSKESEESEESDNEDENNIEEDNDNEEDNNINSDNEDNNSNDDGKDDLIAGIIQRVELENFMSHKHFAIDLGPNVNFIVGANGSGKSAILIALSVALGAKASFTQRGQSVKELITTGEQSARIRVTLSNVGSDAYQRAQYGDAITVERVIGANGANTYRLRDSRGRAQGSGHGAVVAMLDHFGILVDNPCVLLMQDTAKQFLWKQSPTAKYDFFMRATLLDSIMTEYQAVARQCEDSKRELDAKEALLPDLVRHVDALRSERTRAERLGQLEGTIAGLKGDLAWAYVAAARRRHEDAEERYRGSVQRRAQVEEAGAKLARQAADISAEFGAQSELLESKKREIDEHKRRMERLQQRKHEIRDAHARVSADIRDRGADLARKRKRLEIVRNNVQAARDKAAREASQSQSQAAAQREVLAARRDEALRELDAQKGRVAEADARVREQQVSLQQARRKLEEAQRAVRDARGRVQGLRAQSKTRATALGQRMPELIARVAERRGGGRRGGGGGFRDGVLGPIGMEVGLREPRWATAVECVLKPSVLGTFVVYNSEDAAALRGMARELGMQLPVMIVPHAERRYALADEPPEEVRTILRVLDIPNHDVANALIDHHHIHKVALVDDPKEGFSILKGTHPVYKSAQSSSSSSQMLNSSLSSSQRVGGNQNRVNAPTEAFTAEGDKLIVRGGSTAFYSHPKRARGNGRVWFGVDFKAEIAALTHALAETLEPGERAAEEAYAGERGRLRELEVAHRDALEGLRPAEVRLRSVEGEIERHERAERERQQGVDFESMERQGAEIEGEISAIEATLEERRAREEEVRRELEENKRALQDAKAAGDEFAAEVLRLRERITPLQASLQDVVESRARNKSEFEAASIAAAHLAEDAQARLRELDEAAEKARRVCPEERDVRRPPDEIARDIATYVSELEAGRRRLRSVEDIDADLAKASRKLGEVRRKCEAIRGNEYELRRALKTRSEKVREMRDTITRKMKRLFANVLERRQCKGDLLISHSERSIDMNVCFDTDAKAIKPTTSKSNIDDDDDDDDNYDVNDRGKSKGKGRDKYKDKDVIKKDVSSNSSSTNTKTLSGGERSYSTIAFLVALWEAVECPFCALDEFDVFMDSVNRKVAIKTLLEFAKVYGHRQFIVITPQTDINLEDSANVMIKRLKPPVRGVSPSSTSSSQSQLI